jgi:Cu/Ag efflux pump CusA
VFADRAVVVRLTGPPGMSLTEMDRMTTLATGELMELPAVQNVGATVGRAVSASQVVNTNTALLWVTIRPSADYGQALAAVRGVADGTPGLTGTVSTYESDTMTGLLTGPPATVVTRVYGTDYGELERLAGQLRAHIARLPGVRSAAVRLPFEQPTVDVEVNLDAAARAGISPGDVRREAGTLLSGLTVGNYFENQQVFDVVVWGSAAVRGDLPAVGNLLLDTADGGHVRLGSVATITVRPEPADIAQEAMSRYLDVTALVSGGQAGAVRDAIAARVAATSFPLEYHAELVSGDSAELSPNGPVVPGTSRLSFAGYLIAALAFVLLLAHAATRSWRLAALALISLPLSLAGGVLTVFAIGAAGELAAAAGLLAVVALAARQAIAVTARYRAPAADDSSGDAGSGAGDSSGELAIIATPALVTAVAVLPFAVMGDVPGMELAHTAAAVILGGLITTTLVRLFALPEACRLHGPRQATQSPAELLEVR